QLTRERIYGDLWFRDIFRVYAEIFWASTFNQDLPPLVIDRNLGDFLNLFADLKVAELYDHPVYFRGGRQELLFGSQRLISPLDWANTRRTFEGGRLFYRGDKWDVDAFVVSPVVPTVNHFFSSINANEVFSGAWATYRPKAGQALDAYYLNLDNTSGTPVTLGLPAGPYNVNTVGGRWVGDANNWTWDVEGDLQFGDFQQRHILAKAFSAGAGYRFADLPMTPQLWAYYDYASGDPDPSNAHATYGTFNQLFPFGHYYFGFLDLVGRQNINDVNFQVSLFPTKWITTYLQYHVFRLDSAKDALYNAAGTPIRRDPTGAAGNDVGDELDYVINFHIDKHQDVLFGYSHLFAGQFIRQTGNGRSPELTYLQYSFRW
ncbi:MAG TPA: alginate export family protein, partial [Gemmataceae bacterium]|nr:alginate export family protein [Gemmataceae bacterium]